MWASSPGPGPPFSIGSSGAGAWKIFSHSRQADRESGRPPLHPGHVAAALALWVDRTRSQILGQSGITGMGKRS